MPETKPQVYEGDSDYVFVSYAHADRRAVLPIIRALVDEGHRVWYDDGIELATSYPDYIADHVFGCAVFLMFVSRNSNASQWCCDEVNYALDLGRPILPVYLEDVELRRGLRMRLGARQSMFCTRFSSRDAFCRELFRAEVLRACRTAEGASRLGADPWGEFSSMGARATHPRRAGVWPDDKSQAMVSGVVRRGSLAEYSWDELKELSRAIASAGSDAEGLAIAREHHLVDKDGKLTGDEKPFALNDGTRTSVRVLGFRHDELAGGGKAGISFEFADAPARYRMNPTDSNAGGWEGSEMREWLNSEFLSRLPDDLLPHVGPVWKLTNNRGQVDRENDTSVVRRNADGPDRLWLLSFSEVHGSFAQQSGDKWWSPATYDAEGAQYQLYTDRNVTLSNFEPCKKGGAGSWWWLRSPGAYVTRWFLRVGSGGDWSGSYASRELGVSPGFSF